MSYTAYLKKRPLYLLALAAFMFLALSIAHAEIANAYDVFVGVQSGTTTGGAAVYKYESGTTWTNISSGVALGQAVMDMKIYKNTLYAATQTHAGYGGYGGVGQIWQYNADHTWTKVGELDTSAMKLVVYQGNLYVATTNASSYQRGRLYKYSGTPNNWTLVGTDSGTGFYSATVSSLSGSCEIVLGDLNTDRFTTYSPTTGLVPRQNFGGSCVWDFAEYNGALYSGHYWGPIYKTTNDRTWTRVLYDSRHNWALEVFKGNLYVGGSGLYSGGSYNGTLDTLSGTTLSRVWTYASSSGSADGVTRLAASPDGNLLYIGTGIRDGYYTGNGKAEVWTYDGTNITKISPNDYFAGGVQSLLIGDLNVAPVAYDTSVRTKEDTPVEITLKATDANNDPLTYSIVSNPSYGLLSPITGNKVTYTPFLNYYGKDSFIFKANDGKADSNQAYGLITIDPVNDPPVANPDTKTVDEDTVLTFPASDLTKNDTDVDSDTLTVIDATATVDTHGTVTLTNGSISYVPDTNFNGQASFLYKISDGHGGTAFSTVTVTVNPVNDAPVAIDDSAVLDEDTSATVSLGAHDVESEPLTYAIVNGPAHGTLSVVNGNMVTYTPDANYYGPDSFTFKANDGQLDSNVATVSITVNPVNDPPIINANNGTITVDEGTKAVNTGTWSDIANENENITLTASAGNITKIGTGASGTFSWEFNAVDGPADSQDVTVTASDGGLPSSVVFKLIVNNVAPTITSLTAPTKPVLISDGVNTSATFTDPGILDTHTAVWDWGDGTTSNGVVTEKDGSGSITGSHIFSKSGVYTATLTVEDKDHGVARQSFKLDINAPPVISQPSDITVDEGTLANYTGTVSDPDNDPVTLTASSGTIINNGNGTWSWSFNAVDGPADSRSVTITADDGRGGVTATTFKLTVNNVAPKVDAITAPTNPVLENAEVKVSANFTDPGVLDTHTATIDWGDGTTSNGVVTETNGSGSVAGTHNYVKWGTYTITIIVTDKDGGTGKNTCTVTINALPQLPKPDDKTFNEGDLATNGGVVSDPDGDVVKLSASIGTIVNNGNGTWSWSFQTKDGPTDSQVVTITADDGRGGVVTTSFNLTVNNVAPVLGNITAPVDPVSVGTTVNMSANFTDQGTLDTHTAVIDWGDGTTSTGVISELNGSGSVASSHAYATAGVYVIKATVTDKDGMSASSIYQYVVVYDPNGGFVTGGGWITSPSGAYVADPSLTGKAIFGFVSKYLNGASTPSGNTEFQFKLANLNFHSTSYEWLVVAGAKAQYKGEGTINGSGNYGFMLTSTDGQVAGGGGIDKFRIKIWDKATGAVIYDNQLGAADNADATTELGGGSIVIHH